MVIIDQASSVDLRAISMAAQYTDGELRAIATCGSLSAMMWKGIVDGRTAALWGVIPGSILSDRAYLWLITNDHMDKHTFILVRHSQRVVEELLREFPVIAGHCEVGQDRSIRWLKWLGARFGEPDGARIPFEIRRKG